MPLSQLQSDFAKGLTDPNAPVPEGVVDPDGHPAPKRYAVYRNNVTVSLIENLKAAYPAIMALIGEKPFEGVAREFIRANPPQSPVMLEFGRGFPPFLGKVNELNQLPFLPDVGRLERDWLQSYHAQDDQILDVSTLNGISDAQWAGARFEVHPAARLLDSIYPIVDLWRAGKSGNMAGIDPNLAQWSLITRPEFEVQVIAVSQSSGPFLRDMMQGDSIAVAAAKRIGDPKFDLQRVMGRILPSGIFSGVILGDA